MLVTSESASRGKKTVIHEYPNSDKRFVEELGKLPPSFNLVAVVHGIFAIEERYNLESALEETGLGTLVHPVYGSIEVMVLDFSVNSSQSRTGEFIFNISFAISEEAVTPTPMGINKEFVSASAEDARESVDDAMAEAMIPPRDENALVAMADNLGSVFDAVQSNVMKAVKTVDAKTAKFNMVVNSARNDVYGIVQSGQQIKQAMISVYDTALAVTNDPSVLSAAWRELTQLNLSDNGSTSNIGHTDTVIARESTISVNVEDEHTRLTGLINYAEALAYGSYKTVDDLNIAKSDFDDLFDSFFRGGDSETRDLDIPTIIDNPTVRSTMIALRVASSKDFAEKVQNTWNVDNLNLGVTSTSLATYQCYGNLDNIDTINGLNANINNATIINEMAIVK